MIITRIIGGLGNQMFQYASAKALALRHNSTFALDISGFRTYTLHQGFELPQVFQARCNIATPSDMCRVLGWRESARIRQVLARFPIKRLVGRRLIIEPHYEYWPGFEQLPADCYLSGYWQSERYFAKFIDSIRSDFSFKQKFVGQNAKIAEDILRLNAVSLHVRRGDYAANPTTMATHGLCTPSYYNDAIRHLTERTTNLHVFVFSDDISWVKQHLSIPLPHTLIQNNLGSASHNDMHLMSLCRHHIIANSSFSWWGAWLNRHSDKIVVAPRNWFARPTDTRDLFPRDWYLL